MCLQDRLRRRERLRRRDRILMRNDLRAGRDLLHEGGGVVHSLPDRPERVRCENRHLRLTAEFLLDPIPGVGAEETGTPDVVEADVAVLVRDPQDVADELDTRVVSPLEKRRHRVGVQGQHGHRVDAFGDPGVDLGDLLVRLQVGRGLAGSRAALLRLRLGSLVEHVNDRICRIGLVEPDRPLRAPSHRCAGSLGNGGEPADRRQSERRRRCLAEK